MTPYVCLPLSFWQINILTDKIMHLFPLILGILVLLFNVSVEKIQNTVVFSLSPSLKHSCYGTCLENHVAT